MHQVKREAGPPGRGWEGRVTGASENMRTFPEVSVSPQGEGRKGWEVPQDNVREPLRVGLMLAAGEKGDMWPEVRGL